MNIKELYERDMDYYFSKMASSFIGVNDFNGNILMHIILEEEKFEKWIISINHNNCQIKKYNEELSDVTIKITKQIFIDSMLGKVDMMSAFSHKKYIIQGQLRVASLMSIMFDAPKAYDEWFFLLERNILKNQIKDKNIVYRFCIKNVEKVLKDEDDVDFKIIENESYSYRNIIIKDGICNIIPLDQTPFNVEFKIDDLDLLKLIEGDYSFFDVFLLSKLEFNGSIEDAYNLPNYFDKELFVNRSIKYFSINNVFNVMHKMLEEIPSELNDRVIQFKFTGKEKGNFFLIFNDNTLTLQNETSGISRIHAIITMNSDVFLKICCNELDYADAFEDSLITYKGDMSIGILYDSLFKFRLDFRSQ